MKNDTAPISSATTFSIARGRNEFAAYTTTPNPRYRGNPLIEALPPVLSDAQIVDALAHSPPFDEKHRQLPAEERVHLVHTILDLFVPLPDHIYLAERVSCLIREGYTARNPIAQEFWRTFQVRHAADASSAPQLRVRSSARGMTVIGVSGGGKTTAIEAVLNIFPQIIQHTEYAGKPFTWTQICWLKLQCPFDGSTRGLCLNFFQTIDELIGTNHYRSFGQGRRSIDELMPAMKRVASLHSIGVLVIDEIQHLDSQKSGGKERMLNFFCELVNTIGVPVIFIGTPKAMSVLGSEFRQTRRGTGEGDVVWDRLEKSQAWEFLLEVLLEYQYVQKPTLLTPELSQTLYDETQGVVDITVKMLMLSQMRAIKSGREVITPEIIRSVAKDSFRTIQPALNALRRGDYESLLEIPDLQPIDFHREAQRIARESRMELIKAKACPPAASPVSVIEKKPTQPPPTVQIAVERSTAPNLVQIGKRAKEAKMLASDALAAAGFIQSPIEFLNVV